MGSEMCIRDSSEGGNYKPAFAVNVSNKWPGGGILTTPMDLVRLAGGLLDPAFIRRHVQTEFTTVQVLSDGTSNPQRYALGLRVDGTDSPTVGALHHGGTAVGGAAYLFIDPHTGITVAVMTNTGLDSSDRLGELARRIAAAYTIDSTPDNKRDTHHG